MHFKFLQILLNDDNIVFMKSAKLLTFYENKTLKYIFRYYTESYFEPVATFCGILQTILYADFFYLYFTRVSKKNTSMELTVWFYPVLKCW